MVQLLAGLAVICWSLSLFGIFLPDYSFSAEPQTFGTEPSSSRENNQLKVKEIKIKEKQPEACQLQVLVLSQVLVLDHFQRTEGATAASW